MRRRLQQATPWLQHLLEWVLSQRGTVPAFAGFQVVLVDATRLSPPGAKGASWRAHALLDPWTAQTRQLQLTDHKGGEHLCRFQFGRNDLVIADSGYAHRRGLAHVVAQDANFLVRTNWRNLPFETHHGRDFDLFGSVEHLAERESAEFEVRIKADKERSIPSLPCRLIVLRKDQEAAQAAQKKALREAKRKKQQIDERTLKACHYVFLVTNTPSEQLSTAQVLELYGLRWQIELGFKRWKSLLHVNDMHVRQKDSVRATLTAKLLGAVLVEGIVSRHEPGENLWQITQKVGDAFRQALKGESAVRDALAGKGPSSEPEKESHRHRQRTKLRESQAEQPRNLILTAAPA